MDLSVKPAVFPCLFVSLLLCSADGLAQPGALSRGSLEETAKKKTYGERLLEFAEEHSDVTKSSLKAFGCLTDTTEDSVVYDPSIFATFGAGTALTMIQNALVVQTADSREIAVNACRDLMASAFNSTTGEAS